MVRHSPTPNTPSSAPVTAEGFTHRQSLGGISEYVLEANGLTVLLKPDHSAPVATFMVTYLVGSRNEVTGTTGATHFLEHLMFKGSERFNDPAGTSIKQYLGKVGGGFNATTSVDRTNYFATLGRDHLEEYIAIEADRMCRLWLRDEDRRSEMTVIVDEYERGRNDPGNLLYAEVTAAAYHALPYRHATIGWKCDIVKVSTEKLRAFYDTYYWPDNATVTVVGDFEPAAMLALVRKYFGGFSRAPQPIPEMYAEEPEQTGPRRVVVKRPGQLGLVQVAHKAPPACHPDKAALDLLNLILAKGKNSRLYRALVDRGLATSAEAWIWGTRDLGLTQLLVQLAPGAGHADAELVLQAEVEHVRREGVTAAEVAAAQRQAKAARAYRRDGTAAIARELNECIAVGDWTLFATHPLRLAAVTPADVQRVAQRYLDVDQSTTGWFMPVPAVKS